MLLSFLALLQQPTAPPPPPRAVTDPGIIAVGQRVTPAGVQTIFNGRVASVKFGSTAGEVWAAVPGSAWRMAWRDNRVVSRADFAGRPGVHGVTIDPVTKRVVVSSVSKLPADVAASRTPGGPPLSRAKSVAQLVSYAADSAATMVTQSGPLGDFMAGAPAIAARAGADGHRVAVLPLPADDKLVILDADNGTTLRTVPLGVLPIAAVISADGAVAWVSVFGGAKPARGQRRATQCCDPAAEPVRIDARGLALPGTVDRIDVATGTVTHHVTVGAHPTGIAWDQQRQRLYVANGNSDNVSVIDTRRNVLLATIAIAPFRERRIGLSPTALALSPDAGTLYVTLGSANAVAVFDVRSGEAALRGLIPTGWYPSSIDISPDGATLAVGTLFGVGAGTGRTAGKDGRYVFAERGTLNVIPVPDDAALTAFTTSVAENNHYHLATGPAAPSIAPRATAVARAVPERPGEASLIQHVVYIIRENRTYDQVLGDIGKGASDPSLTMYGRDVTPNAHALSEQFVLLDHFFASGGNSADGHNWLTQSLETAYPMWPLYSGRSYPSEGNDPLTYSSGGFLWESAMAKGKRVVSFGEYAPAPSDSVPAMRARLMAMFRDSTTYTSALARRTLARTYNTRSEIPSLDRILVREYPGWTQEVPDVIKADVVLEHLKDWEKAGQMPHLSLIILPNDHTQGTNPGWCAPNACVADNDLALGRLVEGLEPLVVLEVDGDPGGGGRCAERCGPHRRAPDGGAGGQSVCAPRRDRQHVLQPAEHGEDHRADARAAGAVDVRPRGDGHARELHRPTERPDFRPYTALQPRQSLYDVNTRVGAITGPDAPARRAAAVASSRMNFRDPDAAPTERLNRILWAESKGWRVPYPAVKRSLFFPLAVDVDDDDREEREERREAGSPARKRARR